MNPQVLLFVFLWCLFAAFGDVCYKRWSVDVSRPVALLVVGSVAYMADTFLWAAALVRGLPMAKGSVLMCMLSMLTGVGIGLVYDETLTATNWIGVGFALTAIALLP